MTYCNPTWVGTFGWNKVYPVIKETTMWTHEAPAPGEDIYGGSLLVGSIYPDGTSTWHTVPGALTADELSATDEVEFLAGGALLARVPAAVKPQPEGDVINVVAALPDDFAAVTEIRHYALGQLRAVDPAVVELHHTSRAIRAR